jgi:hypothetical protein
MRRRGKCTFQILCLVRDTSDSPDIPRSELLYSKPSGTGADSNEPLTVPSVEDEPIRSKVTWAIPGQLKRTERVHSLKELVRTLYDLVPPEGIQGYVDSEPVVLLKPIASL